jgi:hypothetical protein
MLPGDEDGYIAVIRAVPGDHVGVLFEPEVFAVPAVQADRVEIPLYDAVEGADESHIVHLLGGIFSPVAKPEIELAFDERAAGWHEERSLDFGEGERQAAGRGAGLEFFEARRGLSVAR